MLIPQRQLVYHVILIALHVQVQVVHNVYHTLMIFILHLNKEHVLKNVQLDILLMVGRIVPNVLHCVQRVYQVLIHNAPHVFPILITHLY